MAFTFLQALGHSVGASLVDPSHLEACAQLILDAGTSTCPSTPWPSPRAAGSASRRPGQRDCRRRHAGRALDVEIFGLESPTAGAGHDIGPATVELFAAVIASAGTVLWNGPMGVFEDERFAHGHARRSPTPWPAVTGSTVVGGGDSVAALDQLGLADKIDHVSTGGGASLELLEFGDLPGLEALRFAPNASRLLSGEL